MTTVKPASSEPVEILRQCSSTIKLLSKLKEENSFLDIDCLVSINVISGVNSDKTVRTKYVLDLSVVRKDKVLFNSTRELSNPKDLITANNLMPTSVTIASLNTLILEEALIKLKEIDADFQEEMFFKWLNEDEKCSKSILDSLDDFRLSKKIGSYPPPFLPYHPPIVQPYTNKPPSITCDTVTYLNQGVLHRSDIQYAKPNVK